MCVVAFGWCIVQGMMVMVTMTMMIHDSELQACYGVRTTP